MVEPDEIRAEWDAEADTFDQEPDHGLTDPATRQAWWQLLADVLPPAPAKVADLGAGTGSISVLLAQHGFTVTGVDLSARMVERATAKAALNNVTGRVLAADAADPDLPPGGFDAVFARHVVWALPCPGHGASQLGGPAAVRAVAWSSRRRVVQRGRYQFAGSDPTGPTARRQWKSSCCPTLDCGVEPSRTLATYWWQPSDRPHRRA